MADLRIAPLLVRSIFTDMSAAARIHPSYSYSIESAQGLLSANLGDLFKVAKEVEK